MAARDSFCLAGTYSCPRLLADLPVFEYFFHRCPVRFDPASIVAAVPVGRYTNLRKFELRAARNSLKIENCDGIVIRPPAGSPPSLDNFLSRLYDKVKSGDVPAPRRELSSGLSTDFCFLA